MPLRVTVTGVDQDIAALSREIETVVQRMEVQTGTEIIADSPVDTGFFRSNWNRSLGSPNFSVRGTRDPSARYPAARLGAGWTVGRGNIFFANGVEYASFLDAGSSGQAPQGVTEPVATRIDARFNRVP